MENARSSILDCLMQQARAFPGKTAFQWLDEDGSPGDQISFASLLFQVRQRAVALSNKDLKGKSALLVYEDVLEFIISFLSCQYLGVIAVPVPYIHSGKQLTRLKMIVADAKVAAILCSSSSVAGLQRNGEFRTLTAEIALIPTDTASDAIASGPCVPERNEISFIQYTSGSTGNPKGVIITAENLLHNQRLISDTFGCTPDSIIFSWLPFHHDMGLIGNILHSIYIGCSCILMSPVSFVQNPLRWIDALSRYKVTHSGGPNFAYDLCVDKIPAEVVGRMDLSNWRVAYNGSEMVQPLSLTRFAAHFKPAGFDPASFFPCYGLAEATLLVAGGKPSPAPTILHIARNLTAEKQINLVENTCAEVQSIVSSGKPVPGIICKIISPTTYTECDELAEGEICLHGQSISKGYWNKGVQDQVYTFAGVNYLRTGDLGFLYQGELFVRGRLKEMLLINGKNIYPTDVEQLIAESHPAIVPDGVVIFGLDVADNPVVIAEIKRTALQTIHPADVIHVIDNAVRGYFGFSPYDIVLTTPLTIPRTTSGKRQRLACAALYHDSKVRWLGKKLILAPLNSKVERDLHLLQQVVVAGGENAIRRYLINLIESKAGALRKDLLPEDFELAQCGIDSLRASEIVNCINRELGLNITFSRLMHDSSMSGLVQMIDHMLWLRKQQPAGKEIIL